METFDAGIEDMELYVPKTTLSLPETFAPENGEDPGKFIHGLGTINATLPDVYEDIVTMGANASLSLLERNNLEPEDIGRIDVATESAFDHSKPVSTYIAGCLEQVMDGDFNHADKGERKFACIAGTQSINDAVNWVESGRNRGKKALVVMTDTAWYERDDPGESTQGAGAVATLVSEEPELVELSVENGIGSEDETDFLKPDQQFPSVDGKRSMNVYLSRMREALRNYEDREGELRPDGFEYIPFHTPFPGMARKAARLGYRHLVRGTEVEEELSEDIGGIPDREDFDGDEEYEKEMKEYMDRLEDTDSFKEWYSGVVEPTLEISPYVGNWYTGSVHVARYSALQDAKTERNVGSKMLVGSYGSGAQAEVHGEIIGEGVDRLPELDMERVTDERYDLDWEEYKKLHDHHERENKTEISEPFVEPENEFVFVGYGEMGEREYEYV